MRKEIWVCATALLALGACHKKADTTSAAAQSGANTPAAAAPAATPASIPTRKAGLWKQTMSSDRMSQETSICIDAAVEQKMNWWSQQAETRDSGCARVKVTPRLTGGWEFTSSCDMGSAGHIDSHGVATGDFNNHYAVDIDSTTSGSSMPSANGSHKMKIDAVWQGPCPAGMKPGDMALPGGMKINVIDMANGTPAMGARPSHADMEKMRANALAMARAMHKQGGE